MCSINGLINLNRIKITTDIVDNMKNIIVNSELRGKDGFGYTIFTDSDVIEYRSLSCPSKELNNFSIPEDAILLINNNRAEPTTEYIRNKTLADIQPYKSKFNFCVHNGTIANDKKLKKDYDLDIKTDIDSAVLPFLFDLVTTDDEAIKMLSDTIIGSYATAIYNSVNKKLYLATNYKPLYIAYDSSNSILYFTSLESYMIDNNNYNNIFSPLKIMEIKPYTLLSIDLNSRTHDIKFHSLYPTKIRNKCIVLASSGLDSTVAATWAQDQGYEVTLLHFDYHCKAASKEILSIRKIAEHLNCKLDIINIDFYRDVIHGSTILDNDVSDINKNNEAGAEFAHEWVPARNLVLMSIASAYCEAHDIDYIILGGNLEESGAYSDNELIFQVKFNDLLPNALNLNYKLQVLMPVANLMKKDIVELGLKLNAPLHLTWSCYEHGDLHCGTCGPCFMRKTAFKMLNEKEVIKYLND